MGLKALPSFAANLAMGGDLRRGGHRDRLLSPALLDHADTLLQFVGQRPKLFGDLVAGSVWKIVFPAFWAEEIIVVRLIVVSYFRIQGGRPPNVTST